MSSAWGGRSPISFDFCFASKRRRFFSFFFFKCFYWNELFPISPFFKLKNIYHFPFVIWSIHTLLLVIAHFYFENSVRMLKILYGFLRLRIPSGTSPILPDLKGCALIRELHVYGKLKKVCCALPRDVVLAWCRDEKKCLGVCYYEGKQQNFLYFARKTL